MYLDNLSNVVFLVANWGGMRNNYKAEKLEEMIKTLWHFEEVHCFGNKCRNHLKTPSSNFKLILYLYSMKVNKFKLFPMRFMKWCINLMLIYKDMCRKTLIFKKSIRIWSYGYMKIYFAYEHLSMLSFITIIGKPIKQ